MKKYKIHHHASVMIIPSKKNSEFLLDIYDGTYPKKSYRGKAHLIGGSNCEEDFSPRGLLEREIKEEFSQIQEEMGFDKNLEDLVGEGSPPKKIENFASKQDIKFIRDAILKNSVPYQDFFVKIPQDGSRPQYDVIYSVYLTNLNSGVFEIIRENLNFGKSIKNEGFPRIININKLKKGNPLTAAATGLIIGYFLKTHLPNPELIVFAPLGKPRDSFSEYLIEFEYKNPVKQTLLNKE